MILILRGRIDKPIHVGSAVAAEHFGKLGLFRNALQRVRSEELTGAVATSGGSWTRVATSGGSWTTIQRVLLDYRSVSWLSVASLGSP
jgi:hypothetical protein